MSTYCDTPCIYNVSTKFIDWIDRPDVSDVCVVGVPHEFNGEAPMSFVVLSQSAVQRIKMDPEASNIKALLIKASPSTSA